VFCRLANKISGKRINWKKSDNTIRHLTAYSWWKSWFSEINFKGWNHTQETSVSIKKLLKILSVMIKVFSIWPLGWRLPTKKISGKKVNSCKKPDIFSRTVLSWWQSWVLKINYKCWNQTQYAFVTIMWPRGWRFDFMKYIREKQISCQKPGYLRTISSPWSWCLKVEVNLLSGDQLILQTDNLNYPTFMELPY
jgi:hypothetical protein